MGVKKSSPIKLHLERQQEMLFRRLGAADMSSLGRFIRICRCWQLLASTLSAFFRFMCRTIKAKRNQVGWCHVTSHSKGLNGFWGSYSWRRSRHHHLWPLVGHEVTHGFSIIHQDTNCSSDLTYLLLSCAYHTWEDLVGGGPFRNSLDAFPFQFK